MDSTTSSGRLAIRCVRPDLIDAADRSRIEQEMTALGTRLGRAVDLTTVEIDPAREGAFTTVMLALRRTGAETVIVPDLEHVDGLDDWIRQHAELITVEGERVLERASQVQAATA